MGEEVDVLSGLLVSLGLNLALTLLWLRARRVAKESVTKAKAINFVNHELVAEVERKLGPKKAARIAGAMSIQVQQSLAPKENEDDHSRHS